MIGIDEVGRGCWAGPLLVVAARSRTELPAGLRDSKKLSKIQRNKFHDLIIQTCDLGEGWVEPAEIDELGLTGAMKLAVSRALLALGAIASDKIIMDGSINYCAPNFENVECVVKADDLHPIVSAASIYAKVTRDRRMTELSLEYPNYGFESHVGYGTKIHAAALQKLGICSLHRKSFKPVYTFLQ